MWLGRRSFVRPSNSLLEMLLEQGHRVDLDQHVCYSPVDLVAAGAVTAGWSMAEKFASRHGRHRVQRTRIYHGIYIAWMCGLGSLVIFRPSYAEICVVA